GTDDVGGTKPLSKLQPVCIVPYENDASRAEHLRREDRTQSYRSIPDDDRCFAGLQIGRDDRVVASAHHVGKRQKASKNGVIAGGVIRNLDKGCVGKGRSDGFGLPSQIFSSPESAVHTACEKAF